MKPRDSLFGWVTVGGILGLMAVPSSSARAQEVPAQQPASEAEGVPWLRPTASFFTRHEVRRGYEGVGIGSPSRIGDQDAIYYRARLGLTTRPIEVDPGLDVVLRMVPQSAGVWHVGGDALEDASLDLHEGALELHGQALRLEIGRFEMAYGDELVIGPVGWNEVGRSFDAARLRIAPDPDRFWVDVFASWIDEGLARGVVEPYAARDVIFTGAYAGLGGLVEGLSEWDVYLLGLIAPRFDDPGTGAEVETIGLVTLGSRVKNRTGMLDYRLEAGLQAGTLPGDAHTLAYHGDLEVGVHLAADRLRLALEGLYASGDDPGTADNEGWTQLFPTAHRWLGLTDVIGPRTNVASGVAHVSVAAMERLKLYADGHLFFRPENANGAYAGFEIDAGGAYTLGKGLVARTNYSAYLPSDDMFGTSDPAHFFELELRYTLN